MSTATTNFLRRTVVGLGTGLALFAANAAFAQGTVTLTGTSSNTCSYSQMTVQPNGSIAVTCQGTTGNNQFATFTLSHASSATSYALAPLTSSSATVARAGGPAEPLMVMYSVSGNGCSSNSGGILLLNGGSQTIPFSVGAAGTSCTVTIGAPAGGHIASPNTLTFTAQSTAPPPPPPDPGTPTVPGCPAVPTTSKAGNPAISDFTTVDQLMLGSGHIGYYAVPIPPGNFASVISEITQGQMPRTPANVTTEFQVSLCPGVFDPPGHTIANECRYSSVSVNTNNLKIWTAPAAPFLDQATIAYRGCFAPRSNGQYYLNVRWTYQNCQYDACGFSMKWLPWGSNS